MLKYLLLCSVLLLSVVALSQAEIYKCKDASGATVFVDDSTRIPQGCTQENIIDLPPDNVIPAPTDSQPARSNLQSLSPAPSANASTDAAQQDKEAESFSSLKDEASSLVERYETARKGAYHSRLVIHKQKSRQDLVEIRAQKDALLRKVQASTLAKAEKKEIAGILSEITE